MSYDNPSYWKQLHARLSGSLRAVGHPWLSEHFNRRKYESELASFTGVLDEVLPRIRAEGRIKLLEVGIGTGFWTENTLLHFAERGVDLECSGIDISESALAELAARHPGIELECADLRHIDADRHKGRFDMVVAIYCLHHLTRARDFVNALSFCARSVRPGGVFILMDPLLSCAYSPADVIDFQTFRGNGVPRHLYFVDDILDAESMDRWAVRPAVSFLLNGNIEAPGALAYKICQAGWKLAQLLGRSEQMSSFLGGGLAWLDRRLKDGSLSFSSSVCAYGKRAPR